MRLDKTGIFVLLLFSFTEDKATASQGRNELMCHIYKLYSTVWFVLTAHIEFLSPI